MKNLSLSLLIMGTIVNFASSQSLTLEVTAEEKPTELVSIVSSEDLDDDAYTISVYMYGSAEELSKIKTYNLSEKISINGKQAINDLWISYDEVLENTDKPHFVVSFDIGVLVESNANLAKESGNELKIEFLSEENDNFVSIGSVELKFDVPGYGVPSSEFCGELFEYRATDDKTLATLQTIFNAVYDHSGIVEVLMRKDWSDRGDAAAGNAFMVLFTNNEGYYMLKYDVGYVEENGEVLAKPRVKIYNGLSTPVPVAEACVNALKASLK